VTPIEQMIYAAAFANMLQLIANTDPNRMISQFDAAHRAHGSGLRAVEMYRMTPGVS
jgi:hypothetical protein